jgi:DNA-binding transcriptional LysR family regulator
MTQEHRFKEIQLAQLRSFCLVATSLNFATVAGTLGLSLSAVWRQVRALERKLDVALLRQRGQKMELTDEGRLLLKLVQQPLGMLDSLQQLFATQRLGLPQRLTIAAPHDYFSYTLLRPIAEFRQQHASVRFKLYPCNVGNEVFSLVEDKTAELGVTLYDPDASRNPHLEYEQLYDVQMMLITAAEHPLASMKQVTLRDVVRYPLITPSEDSFTALELARLLRRQDLTDQADIIMEAKTLDVVRRYVKVGMGITLMHLDKVREEVCRVEGLHVRAFDKNARLPVALIRRKSAYLSASAREFSQILRKHFPPSRPRSPRS